MTLKAYILERKNNDFTIRGIHVSLSAETKENTDYKKAISLSLSKIPLHLLTNIRKIIVAPNDQLQKRQIQGMYDKGVIFLTNDHDATHDAINDIVHEVAHSVEEKYWNNIYSDNKIQKEFLQKRKKMWLRLKQRGFEREMESFLKIKYDKDFDRYLHLEVGYPTLRAITRDIFHSPYAATSIREYFADAFEAFYMKEEIQRLKLLSPAAYDKVIMLLNKDK